MSATIATISTESKAILKLIGEAELANNEIMTLANQIRELEAQIDRLKGQREACYDTIREIYKLR